MAAVSKLILDLEGAGLAATVLFNGVILAQDSMAERLSRAVLLNGWAVTGMNSLQLTLATLPAATGNTSRPEPRFALKLRAARPDTPDGSDQVLVDYRWNPATQPLPGTGSLEVLTQSLQLAAPAAWSWTRATPLPQLAEADSQAIGALLGQVHAALAARSIADVVRLQATQVSEQAVAVGEDPRIFLQHYAEFLQERMASQDWTVRPMAWDKLHSTPMAGGRLHRITDSQNMPPIVTSAGGGLFAIEPYVSKVDGRWAIVR